MDKKQQQNVAMLFLASSSSIGVSQIIQSNGSNLMDFSQGMLTGIGIAGMMLAIVTAGRYNKRSQ
ncbi:hypothetical protein P40081_03085 [Paenibacillus sp. FSL P4-0081]|uniref:Holin n=1 Tax=Paenibacillus rhizoplanae TaxID=1917181 RepID=A0ABW5FGV8_9BACL|nr:hypothetical protein [Paenibacillus sp. FSL P4-0081]AIQ27295.1 hypothetical protein P40081_03085 [Paenibacillus sp. FSL P4-0081]